MNRPSGDQPDTGARTPHVDLVAEEDGRRFLDEARSLVDSAVAELEHSYRRALLTVENSLGPDHHEALTLRRHLGDVQGTREGMTDPYRETERLLQRALITFEAVLGTESAEVAVVSHELAQILAHHGRGDEARWLYERALRIRRQVLGTSHPDVATTLHNLALLHQIEGRADEAHALWAQARAALTGEVTVQ